MGYMWGEYVPVATRRLKAKKEMDKLRKKGKKIEPVEIEGRLIARKFWGKKWCEHLESFADYDNRLPRGRTYARNGSISHLSIQKGCVEAIVSGSSLYEISISIQALSRDKWEAIKKSCTNQIGSILEILQGKLSDSVMKIVADHKQGLFPTTQEMKFKCSCPDSARMCKHIAAVLYGVGNRLDSRPELLFLLRALDPSELVSEKFKVETITSNDQLESEELADLFGIDFEDVPEQSVSPTKSAKKGAGSEKISSTEKAPKAPKKTKKALTLDLNNLKGRDLFNYRVKKGLCVSEFATALGVTPASIYRWEKSLEVLKLQASSKEALSNLLKS